MIKIILNAPSIIVFKQNILSFMRFGLNKIFNIYNLHDLKLLVRLRLGLSHLQGHQFKHSVIVLMKFVIVEKILDLCTISSSSVPYFIKKDKSSWITFVILTADQNENSLYYILFGKGNMNNSINVNILNATVEYILSTERFNIPLFEYF